MMRMRMGKKSRCVIPQVRKPCIGIRIWDLRRRQDSHFQLSCFRRRASWMTTVMHGYANDASCRHRLCLIG